MLAFSHVYDVFTQESHPDCIEFHPNDNPTLLRETLLKSPRDSHSSGPEFHFSETKITLSFFIPVRRFHSKSSQGIHKMVSNDPILDSEVVPDELGQLGRPAEWAGRAWPARAGQPGGRASPAGRPGRLAGRWAASREGNEGRAQEGAQRAGADGAPPHPYHRRWVIRYISDKIPKFSLPLVHVCLLYTSPSPRDATLSRMPSSA